ncbi:MAG: hypothetical protein K5765_00430, partial [Clostridia bacterium]|nr:hypothetical protein [Clostridia bacterium]
MFKKIISTILLVSFVFVFLACSNTGENNSYVPAPSGGDGGVFVDGEYRAGDVIGGAGYAGKVKESATGSEIKTGEETNEEQEENKVEIEAGQLTAKALF